jgi:hypothetical protein
MGVECGMRHCGWDAMGIGKNAEAFRHPETLNAAHLSVQSCLRISS